MKVRELSWFYVERTGLRGIRRKSSHACKLVSTFLKRVRWFKNFIQFALILTSSRCTANAKKSKLSQHIILHRSPHARPNHLFTLFGLPIRDNLAVQTPLDFPSRILISFAACTRNILQSNVPVSAVIHLYRLSRRATLSPASFMLESSGPI